MNHDQVVKNFAEGKNRHGSRIFAEGNILYSYGRHFPLAVRRSAGDSRVKIDVRGNKDWYLLNGDKYSVSTSKHQGITYHCFRDFPRVAFSALRAAGIDYNTCKLIDFYPDSFETVYNPEIHTYEDKNKWDNFKVPVGAEYHERKNKDGIIESKSYHRIGATVLEQDRKHFICGMDEGSYFISLLPRKVKAVAEAFQVLKPKEVIAVEKAEEDFNNSSRNNIHLASQIKRQGEWFFIPVDLHFKESQFSKSAALPSADSSSNRHVCTRLLKQRKKYFVKGIVRHKNSFNNRRADHKPVKLGTGKEIYQAVCNTAKGSWSASGRVD
jgi:hypothetical protein